MSNLVEGTDIEVGKWYPASTPPPDIKNGELEEKYDLILAIKDYNIVSGWYAHDEGVYYWNCERYDSFDDEPIEGWTREQEINNNLDLVYEIARGVAAWIIIPSPDNEWPSHDGSNYWEPEPEIPRQRGRPDNDEGQTPMLPTDAQA
ncbi:hypothetical protein IC229_27570 [Spirosoma sp. BT702]|uniref:Uncharacterized protein n=1 Tax=Spirosoma profusum TaxID=2771354 RepID=A0A926Y1N3_9BACT|nr:hypothetical protein [Spirosoma profusum]MBD2704431.1 hypothetical protein [Spirosoma profusum]